MSREEHTSPDCLWKAKRTVEDAMRTRRSGRTRHFDSSDQTIILGLSATRKLGSGEGRGRSGQDGCWEILFAPPSRESSHSELVGGNSCYRQLSGNMPSFRLARESGMWAVSECAVIEAQFAARVYASKVLDRLSASEYAGLSRT
jgi:hypothetical protein